MEITHMRVNHQKNPVGLRLCPVIFSWQVSGNCEKETLRVYAENTLIYESEGEISRYGYAPDLTFKPRTLYTWEVCLANGVTRKAYFVTGKMREPWQAKWITAPFSEPCLLKKDITLTHDIKRAYLHVYTRGLFEAYWDHEKIGEEYLSPGYHSYDLFGEVYTFVLEDLKKGPHSLTFALGDGWYRGRFVFDGGQANIYGDELGLLAELHLEDEIIATDESWQAAKNPVSFASIYDGETWDANAVPEFVPAILSEDQDTAKLADRRNLPIVKKKTLLPKALLHTPRDEWVLDFGQNMTGWVEFSDHLSKGTTVTLEYGEVLQEGCFYRDNLRTARAVFTYTSDGQGRHVRPHFTYFGFRYVRLTGFDKIDIHDFQASLIASDITETGFMQTGHPLVNRLFENAKWGQIDNFLDIPTDCPQRDERMGWTGDAGIISRTAVQNYDMSAFFSHYLENIAAHQAVHHGAVPLFVPFPPLKNPEKVNPFLTTADTGTAIWGDAAVYIIMYDYLHTGDAILLKQRYPIMKAWLDYVTSRTENGLWLNDFQLGDWLALDTGDPQSVFGATDLGYTASLFYYYSLCLFIQAAEDLNNTADVKYYRGLAEKTFAAVLTNYFDENGAFKITPTQTACVLALYFGVYNEKTKPYLKETLKDLIARADGHLNTGFAGTPFILFALSENGMVSDAYDLFLKEDLPGWLYPVTMGATTIWERWNSMLPDGSVSSTGMNSFNHYAYGSVIDWLYRVAAGLSPKTPGYKQAIIAPHPEPRLGFLEMSMQTPSGRFQIAWRYVSNRQVAYDITIPDGVAAVFISPDENRHELKAGTNHFEIEDTGGQ